MALLHIDGFDNYGTTVGAAPSPVGIMGREYPISAGLDTGLIRAGRLDGYCYEMDDNSGRYMSPGDLTTNATLVVGFALQIDSDVTANVLLSFYDGVTLGMNLYLNANNEISVRRGTSVLATTSGLNLAYQT